MSHNYLHTEIKRVSIRDETFTVTPEKNARLIDSLISEDPAAAINSMLKYLLKKRHFTNDLSVAVKVEMLKNALDKISYQPDN